MPSTTVKRRPVPQPELELLAVQRLACASIVQGCERSLYQLRCSLGEARDPADVRAGLQAAELLEGVLASWRETLDVLAAAGLDDQRGAKSANVYPPFISVNDPLMAGALV